MRLLSLCCLLLFFVMGCRGSTVATRGGGALKSLHTSRLDAVTNDARRHVGLFPDGEHVVVADSLFTIKRLYLIDLVAGEVTELSVGKRPFVAFGTVPDGVVVESALATAREGEVLWLSPSGEMRPLIFLDLTPQSAGDVASVQGAEARFATLLAEGQVEGLTRIETLLVNTEGPFPAEQVVMSYFINEHVYIAIKGYAGHERPELEERITDYYLRDEQTVVEPSYPGLTIQVAREPSRGAVGPGDDRRIREIVITQGDQEHRFAFDQDDYYYHTLVIEDRLYIIGSSVLYIELDNLPPTAGGIP